jgi:hypothetical protein
MGRQRKSARARLPRHPRVDRFDYCREDGSNINVFEIRTRHD